VVYCGGLFVPSRNSGKWHRVGRRRIGEVTTGEVLSESAPCPATGPRPHREVSPLGTRNWDNDTLRDTMWTRKWDLDPICDFLQQL
jgi:hypothetical protein